MYRLLLILALIWFSFCAYAQSTVKYVFLLIGDGFGMNQRIVAEAAVGRKLVMNTMDYTVDMGTNTFDGKTTDSAASGTAIACGMKTHTYAIGVDKDDKPVESLPAELKRTRGFSIGILSSCGMTDATTAAQYAHQAKRYFYKQIGDDMVRSDFDLFGGFNIFESPDIGNREKLEKEYRQKLRDAGRQVLEGPDSFSKIVPGKRAYIACTPYIEWEKSTSFCKSIFGEKHLSLADYLNRTIELFQNNPNGFYIMLECGRVDHTGHLNEAGAMVREVRAFDEAVAAALAFQNKHPEETLVIVTADHETGGLKIEDMKLLKENVSLLWKQTSQKEQMSKDWQKQEITDAMLEKMYGISFTDEEQLVLTGIRKKAKVRPSDFLKTVSNMRDSRLGIRYTSGSHTNARVLTSVSGPGARLFTTVQPLENSSLRGIITDILNGKR